jgi:hypothetical protein
VANLSLEDAAKASGLMADCDAIGNEEMMQEIVLSFAKQTPVTGKLFGKGAIQNPPASTDGRTKTPGQLTAGQLVQLRSSHRAHNKLMHAIHGNGVEPSAELAQARQQFEPIWESMKSGKNLMDGLNELYASLAGVKDKHYLREFVHGMMSLDLELDGRDSGNRSGECSV